MILFRMIMIKHININENNRPLPNDLSVEEEFHNLEDYQPRIINKIE